MLPPAEGQDGAVRMSWWLMAAVAIAAGGGNAQQQQQGGAPVAPATPPAATPRPAIQQLFDAAVDQDDSGTPETRLAAWEAFERAAHGNRRSLAIARIRKSSALGALGRRDEAVEQIRLGLADLPAKDATLREDRFNALLRLGLIARDALDYPAAIAHFHAADAVAAAPGEKISVLLGLLKTETYIDPPAAAQTVARLDALTASVKTSREVLAEVRRLDAERLLNLGDAKGAQAQAGRAVDLLGGLTEHTKLDDVRVRSDYAIAALLNGQQERARRYLAMSGAGRQPDGAFSAGVNLAPPDCGGEAGLKPADLAVVEFSIGDDGRVIESEPIYAAGGGRVALEFARIARDWYWTPEQVSKIKPFFRSKVRIEMRCSTGFERPSIYDYIDGALAAWLRDKGVEPPPFSAGADAAVLATLRTQLAASDGQGGGQSLRPVPILMQIATSAAASREERLAAATRAAAILRENGAGALPRAAAQLRIETNRGAETGERALAQSIGAALADPVFANDAEARAALRLIAAGALRGKPKLARPWLSAVADDPALPPGNPLRASAWIQIASLDQGEGDSGAARAAFVKSGLQPSQCALVDQGPRLVRSSGNFPTEALQWGFEGWTQVQFDVDAAGAVRDARVVLAYPPFVFSDAGRRAMAGARYSASYRPDGGLGCGGIAQRVRFQIQH